MKFTSQPAAIAPDEAAARFTRATELLMRAAERRKAAQALFVAVAPIASPLAAVATSNGRYVYHHAQAQSYPASMGGAA